MVNFILYQLAYIMTHINLIVDFWYWTHQCYCFSVSGGQFGLYSTIMILGPTQYYFFIDNTLLDYIPFSNICLISIIYSRMIGLCNSAYHDRCSDMYLSPQLHVLPKTVKRKEDFSLPRGNSLWNSILLHFFFKKGNVHFFLF